MFFIQGTGKEPILPKIARKPVLLVEPAGVDRIRSSECLRKRVWSQRNRDQMHMIRHPTIRANDYAIFFGVLDNQLCIPPIIRDFAKNVGFTDSSLSDVVRNFRDDNARISRHGVLEWIVGKGAG